MSEDKAADTLQAFLRGRFEGRDFDNGPRVTVTLAAHQPVMIRWSIAVTADPTVQPRVSLQGIPEISGTATLTGPAYVAMARILSIFRSQRLHFRGRAGEAYRRRLKFSATSRRHAGPSPSDTADTPPRR